MLDALPVTVGDGGDRAHHRGRAVSRRAGLALAPVQMAEGVRVKQGGERVVVPAQRDGTDVSQALAAVLGRSRTLLLTELDTPASTTDLARRTGLSAGGCHST